MPDLRQLRAFVAVAEELNFSRAGERLHLGQQAVSKSVRQLEDELGVELLERTTREVGLTPAGAALLESGRPLLADADAAFRRAQDVGRAVDGVVTAGVSPALSPVERERLVQALRSGAPELTVNVREIRPAEIAPALRDRTVDLVLARASYGEPETDSAALAPTPMVLCVPAGHRLAAEADERPVALRELDGERLLVHNPRGTPYTDMLVDRLEAAGVRVDLLESHVMGTSTLIEVAAAEAVALMPAGTPPTDGVVQRELAEPVTVPLVVQWSAGAANAAVRRVRDAMSG